MKYLFLDVDGNSIGRNPTITPVDEGLHDVSYVPPPVGMQTHTASKIDRSKIGKIDILKSTILYLVKDSIFS